MALFTAQEFSHYRQLRIQAQISPQTRSQGAKECCNHAAMVNEALPRICLSLSCQILHQALKFRLCHGVIKSYGI